MKQALDKEGLKPYLMMQPIGYHAPDGGSRGFIDLPELPFGELQFLHLYSVITSRFHLHWEIVPTLPLRPSLVALYVISQSIPEYLTMGSTSYLREYVIISCSDHYNYTDSCRKIGYCFLNTPRP